MKNKSYWIRFKEAIGFGMETGAVGKITIGAFVLIILANIFYYLSLGKIVLILLKTSLEKMYDALLSGKGLSAIVSNTDAVNLSIFGYMSLFFSIFLVGLYVVLFLYCSRRQDGTLPKGSASYYLYVSFSIMVTASIYMLINVLISSIATPLIVAFWPVVIFAYCNRAEFGGTAGVAIGRSFKLMGRNIWMAILYGILTSLIIFVPAFIITIIIAFFDAAMSVRIGIIVFVLADAVYLLTMSRMFVGMYVDNVAMPKPLEEEK